MAKAFSNSIPDDSDPIVKITFTETRLIPFSRFQSWASDEPIIVTPTSQDILDFITSMDPDSDGDAYGGLWALELVGGVDDWEVEVKVEGDPEYEGAPIE